MQAAVGNIQLKKLNKIINRNIFNFYKKNLENIREISLIEKFQTLNQCIGLQILQQKKIN